MYIRSNISIPLNNHVHLFPTIAFNYTTRLLAIEESRSTMDRTQSTKQSKPRA